MQKNSSFDVKICQLWLFETNRLEASSRFYRLVMKGIFSSHITRFPLVRFPLARFPLTLQLNHQYSPTNAIFLYGTFFSKNQNERNVGKRCIWFSEKRMALQSSFIVSLVPTNLKIVPLGLEHFTYSDRTRKKCKGNLNFTAK